MWKYINENIMQFRECFSRQKPFQWFAIIVVGLMVRGEFLGVTSIVRALGIEPRFYESLLHFFRADSWNLDTIGQKWISIVARAGLLYRIRGKALLIGDGVKQTKEGRKMPAIKKLVQESENSAKPHYMHGHHFGAIGIVLGTPLKLFCTILSLRIHDGNKIIRKWSNDEHFDESHVVRIIREASRIASFLGESILALDSYYLSANALLALDEGENENGKQLITIVTKAKKQNETAMSGSKT